MIPFKEIEERDYFKTYTNISKNRNNGKFKGCLFVYDDKFDLSFTDMLDNCLRLESKYTLKRFLDIWSKLHSEV